MTATAVGPRLLIVNGCEHTAVGAPWPTMLAEQLDVPLINLAVQHASNHRILRTTLTTIPRHVDEAQDKAVGPILFVAMFAELHRTEVPAEAAPRQRRRSAPGDRWTTLGPPQLTARDPRAAAWYRHVYTDVDGITDVLLATTLLGTWLTRRGVQPLFALSTPFDADAARPSTIEIYRSRIDPTWIVGHDLGTWPATALTSAATASCDVDRTFVERVLDHLQHMDERRAVATPLPDACEQGRRAAEDRV